MSARERALAIAAKTLAKHDGELVTYQTSTGVEFPIPDAVLGGTDQDAVDSAGVKLRTREPDWLVNTSRLTIEGKPHEPRPSDRILHTKDGQTITYEVQKRGRSKSWKYSGPDRIRYRIFTRIVPNAA